MQPGLQALTQGMNRGGSAAGGSWQWWLRGSGGIVTEKEAPFLPFYRAVR